MSPSYVGTEFCNEVINKLSVNLGIFFRAKTCRYRPHDNGVCGSLHWVINIIAKGVAHDQLDWQRHSITSVPHPGQKSVFSYPKVYLCVSWDALWIVVDTPTVGIVAPRKARLSVVNKIGQILFLAVNSCCSMMVLNQLLTGLLATGGRFWKVSFHLGQKYIFL